MRRFFLAFAAFPSLAAAQAVTGPYVSLGAGTNLQQDEIVLKAPYVDIPNNRNYQFDAGFSGEVSAGYGIGNGLRMEIEGDFLSNHVSGATTGLRAIRAGGYEEKYGGFLNAFYDLNLGLPIFPYLGIGAGGQIVDQHHVNSGVSEDVFLPPGSPISARDQSVGGFAYQGIAGFALPVPFVSGLSFTTEYRFIGLVDPLPAFKRTFIVNQFAGVGPNGFPVFRQEAIQANRHFTNNLNHSILLGFRYAFYQPAPPPPPAPPAPVAAPTPQPTRTYLVFFDWDRADLTPRARQIIGEAAGASTHVQTTRIEVNGYTDLSGTAAYNLKLSVRRARSVEAELVRDGVPAQEIGIRGYGEANPLVPTAPGVREPQNRRVDIILR